MNVMSSYYQDMDNQTATLNKHAHSIKELVPSLMAAVVLFIVCLSFGLISPPSQSSEVLASLAETLEFISSLGPLELLVIIFFNNATKTFIAMVLGIALGLPPLLFISFNGYLIGLLVSSVEPTTSPVVIIASMAPHGIIEIPVLLLSSAMGIAIGFESFKRLIKRDSTMRILLRWCLGIFFKWFLAALLIAALIEIFITPLIIALVDGGEIPLRIN